MNLNFKEITVDDIPVMMPYYNMRKNKTCDSVFLESFIWKEFYKVRYAIWEDRALLWLMEYNGKCFSAMPLCKEEDLPAAFQAIEEYFNQELGYPLVINLADEYAVKYLNLPEDKYFVKEQEDSRDYLYLGESLRKLSGKKLHKKKNRLNLFLRQYEGRFEYRSLGCADKDDMWKFLDRWRLQKGEDAEEHLDYEVRGIHDILRNCAEFSIHMGGIYIDGKLEAFSVGSYNPIENMAVIHIEKADPEIPGLYQAINQQFLIHEFPEVEWVNREDDLGLEGLRKAKMSYNPADFARKYLVEQLLDGKKSYSWAEEIENTASDNPPEYLSQEEKQETIPLWKECFPEDRENDRYLEYYYNEKTRDNRILVKRQEGRILSMLHRNPYMLQIGSARAEIDYLVAVGTEEQSRGKGYMREVLQKALRDMYLEKRPFTFLMPAAEAIYKPFDFRYIWDKYSLGVTEEGKEVLSLEPVQDKEEDWDKAAAYMEQWLAHHADLYALRDRAYVRRLQKELQSEEGDLFFLRDAQGNLAGLQGLAGKEKQEQQVLYGEDQWLEWKEKTPRIMARITNLEEFLSVFSLKEEGELEILLDVEDKLIPENQGPYLWSLNGQSSRLMSWPKPQLQAAEISGDSKDFCGQVTLQASIGDLTSWLLGYIPAQKLWPDMPPSQARALSQVKLLDRIWLDELV
ncbi:MAG: GNAT family N-acetyltransferase [Blautia sp.]